LKHKSSLTLFGILLAVAASVVILVTGIGESQRLSVTNIRQGLDLRGGVTILYEADIDNPSSADMDAANALLRTRLDARGYTEATVAQEGPGRIRVDIPGVEDAETAISQIGATAMLVFEDEHGRALLDGSHVSSASAGLDGANQIAVFLEFNAEGRQRFSDATRDNLHRQIFIWMDDELLSAPMVNVPITDGSAVISGGQMTMESANLLATQIRQGSLPFGLSVETFSTVGARLGADALRTSIIAGIIGLLLVLIFMAVFYKTMGLAADIALVIYAIIFMLIVSGLGITLSLPGIAGLILSIGMATDANIVIFERIREEIASGKTMRAAMRTGYRRAWPAIVDSNVTTLIAGGVLFWLGTGPIMGFAQMLIIGILLSMFTCLVVTRVITVCLMDLGVIKPHHLISKKQKEALDESGGREVEPDLTQKPVVQNRKWYFIASSAILAIGIVFAVVHTSLGNGFFDLDVEFSGGTYIVVTTDMSLVNSEVEELVRNITGESAPQVQLFSNMYAAGVMIRTTQVTPEIRIALVDALSERYNLTADDIAMSDVSPAVSAQMRRDAMLAIIVASICMLIYISVRFRDVRKGVSAVLAQLHDALVVLCIYAILRIPLNYAFIAVMLTTLGYSINATIIIFDRIRENRRRMPKIENESLINISVTQTLRRTLFSTVSSFIAVLMLYIIGVAAIRDFTLPIMVGLLFGAYSSVCLSGSAWYMMLRGKKAKS